MLIGMRFDDAEILERTQANRQTLRSLEEWTSTQDISSIVSQRRWKCLLENAGRSRARLIAGSLRKTALEGTYLPCRAGWRCKEKSQSDASISLCVHAIRKNGVMSKIRSMHETQGTQSANRLWSVS
jgi:hypothetical protein